MLDGRGPARDTTSVTQAASAPLAISVQHPEDSPGLQAALKSPGLQAKLAGDLQGVASALQPLLQTVIEQRPDLALASFDVHAEHGGITVTSATLDDDKAWLQQTFNASPGLAQAVQTFHDAAVAAWRSWAEADGQSASEISGAELSSRADQQFNFKAMFNQASRRKAGTWTPQASTPVPAVQRWTSAPPSTRHWAFRSSRKAFRRC